MIQIRAGVRWRDLQSFTSSDELVRAVAKYGPSECSCPNCVAACERMPCIGTPEDIEKLMYAGYARHLRFVKWGVGVPFGVPPIPMIQIGATARGCPLLKDGRCTLHAAGLKPTEGVRAQCHEMLGIDRHPAFAAALTWLLECNVPLITGLVLRLAREEARG